MIDLNKRLLSWSGTPFDDDAHEAADRIEALVKERDTAREYAGEVRIREKVADDARIEAEAKLAKAVEALKAAQQYVDELEWHYGGPETALGKQYYATLAELEGKE
jgi:hypothetical protein